MSIENTFNQQQDLRQDQILAPQQLASLSLLTVPAMELENRITEEMSQNPVLEIIENAPVSSDAQEEENILPQDMPENLQGEEDRLFDSNREDYEEHLDHILDPDMDPNASFGRDEEERRQFLFDSIVEETSLQEALLDQLRFAEVTPSIRQCAEYVIGSLDENGWFCGSLPDAAQAADAPMSDAEKALTLVQSFDPPGIAARDLKECLLLQIERHNLDPQLKILVRDHLNDLGRNKLPQIAQSMAIPMERLNDLLEELRTLNPHPGNVLNQSNEPYILPEVTIVPEGDSFRVVENTPSFGRLALSATYVKMLEDPSLSIPDRTWLRTKIDSGKALIHNLEQRGRTIVRIAEVIVNEQFDFMKYGPKALRPMTMKQVADKLGLHETTVSRAVSGKYMQTPVGLYEFRFFFSGGFQSDEGEEVSAHAIKNMIREFVAGENHTKPLSDSKLSNMLKERGFDVARRTVAKYREELGIQSSQLRKVF